MFGRIVERGIVGCGAWLEGQEYREVNFTRSFT